MLNEKKFQFEESVIRLQSGDVFRPLKDAVERWVCERRSPYEVIGPTMEILYQLGDDTFVIVVNECCDRVLNDSDGSQIWTSDSPPNGRRVTDREAADFILSGQRPLPECLESKIEEFMAPQTIGEPKIQEPRPIEFWLECKDVSQASSLVAHEIDPIEMAEDIMNFGIAAVQQLRNQPRLDALNARDDVFGLGRTLFRMYTVDPKKWWGSNDIVPPQQVSHTELPWPKGSAKVECIVEELSKAFRIPYAALRAYRSLPGDFAKPNDQDLPVIQEAVDGMAEILEPLVVELRSAISGYQSFLAAQPPEKEAIKRPSDRAFRVYVLSTYFDVTQQEISEMMKRKTGTPITQGTISRYISSVKRWLDDGNKMPALETLNKDRAKSIDPSKLDMGKREDAHAPRQKPKSLED